MRFSSILNYWTDTQNRIRKGRFRSAKARDLDMKLVATCLFGLEKLLGSEIDALGLRRIETMDGRVIFEGEPRDIPRANIALRCAERVYILLGSFPAKSFAELFDGTRALPFEDWIGKDDLFPVKGLSALP